MRDLASQLYFARTGKIAASKEQAKSYFSDLLVKDLRALGLNEEQAGTIAQKATRLAQASPDISKASIIGERMTSIATSLQGTPELFGTLNAYLDMVEQSMPATATPDELFSFIKGVSPDFAVMDEVCEEENTFAFEEFQTLTPMQIRGRVFLDCYDDFEATSLLSVAGIQGDVCEIEEFPDEQNSVLERGDIVILSNTDPADDSDIEDFGYAVVVSHTKGDGLPVIAPYLDSHYARDEANSHTPVGNEELVNLLDFCGLSEIMTPTGDMFPVEAMQLIRII